MTYRITDIWETFTPVTLFELKFGVWVVWNLLHWNASLVTLLWLILTKQLWATFFSIISGLLLLLKKHL